MKVLTAIEHLKQNAKRQHLKRLKKIKRLIINSIEEDSMKKVIKNSMTICKVQNEIIMDVDELFFEIDGLSFEEFCKKHFIGHFNNDKTFFIRDLSIN